MVIDGGLVVQGTFKGGQRGPTPLRREPDPARVGIRKSFGGIGWHWTLDQFRISMPTARLIDALFTA